MVNFPLPCLLPLTFAATKMILQVQQWSDCFVSLDVSPTGSLHNVEFVKTLSMATAGGRSWHIKHGARAVLHRHCSTVKELAHCVYSFHHFFIAISYEQAALYALRRSRGTGATKWRPHLISRYFAEKPVPLREISKICPMSAPRLLLWRTLHQFCDSHACLQPE